MHTNKYSTMARMLNLYSSKLTCWKPLGLLESLAPKKTMTCLYNQHCYDVSGCNTFIINIHPQGWYNHVLSLANISVTLWWHFICIWHQDVVIKWKHFPRYWPFVRGIHRSPVNSPHKGQWRGAYMSSLICTWMNDWINNCEAGDLRRHRAHYGVTVMTQWKYTKPSALTSVVDNYVQGIWW